MRRHHCGSPSQGITRSVDGFFEQVLPPLLEGLAQTCIRELAGFDHSDWLELAACLVGQSTPRSLQKGIWALVGEGRISPQTAQQICDLLSGKEGEISLEDFQRWGQAPQVTVSDLLTWLEQQPPTPQAKQCRAFLRGQPPQAVAQPQLVGEILGRCKPALPKPR